MSLQNQLFESENIIFAPLDYENDPQVEARWTHDAQYLRLLGPGLAKPLTAAAIKKNYEAIEKEVDESRRLFYFQIRTRPSGDEAGRLIGFAKLYWLDWSNGVAFVQLGIGEAELRGKGYGTEALRLLVHFAFNELNLYRLSAFIPGYNQAAQRLFCKLGFVEEVRQREALHRNGERSDLLIYGLTQPDLARLQDEKGL